MKSLINAVSENIENFQFNKSVAKIYEFVNILNDSISEKKLSKDNLEWGLKKLSIILQPFAPHVSEEIWAMLGNESLCINQNWVDEEVKRKSTIKIAVQINGKTKEIIEIDYEEAKDKVLKIAKNHNKIKKYIDNKNIVREIYVPGKIINLVIK